MRVSRHTRVFAGAVLFAAISIGPAAAQDTTATSSPGPANTRMLPDISVVGDLVFDVSPKQSTQPDGARLGVREIEVAMQAAVDPYFRGDVFLGFSDAEGVHIEEAFLTATALPAMLEVRLGRFRMPVGKQNLTHQHDLHTTEYPHVIQNFFGDEGLAGTGIQVSRIFAPLGFYQEIIVTAVDRFGGHAHEHEEEGHEEEEGEVIPAAPANSDLDGLGYSARLRNYWDLTEAANLEVGFSGITGKGAQERLTETGVEELNVRQSVIGADFTYRWRPPGQGLYRSLIVQAEVMRQLNDAPDELVEDMYLGPVDDVTGAYAFARYQLTRRLHLGARADYLESAGPANGVDADAGELIAGSGYLEFFPSEFSKLALGYERLMPQTGADIDRIVMQATFALGPHKPHPF